MTAAAVLVASSAQAAAPDVSSRITVVVEGQQLQPDDVKSLFAGAYALKAVLVERQPGEMPSYDPLVHYAGRSSTLPAKPLIWYSNANRLATSDAEQAAIEAATTTAFLAAELDFGLAGPTLQSLYAKDSTQQARLALAAIIARALAQSSDAARASAESKTAQIRAQVVPGVSRGDVYAALQTLGLAPDEHPQNANGEAIVTIWGGFTLVPACGGRTQIAFAFDSSDRVKSVTIDGPHDVCV